MTAPDYASRDLEGAAHLAGLACTDDEPRVRYSPAPRGCTGCTDPQCDCGDRAVAAAEAHYADLAADAEFLDGILQTEYMGAIALLAMQNKSSECAAAIRKLLQPELEREANRRAGIA